MVNFLHQVIVNMSIKRNIDVYKEQYYGRNERQAAHAAVGEAAARVAMGMSGPSMTDVAFLETRVKTLDGPYLVAATDVQTRIQKQNDAIATQEAVLAELEEQLWEMHGDTSRTKDYIALRQKYVEGIVALREIQYPRRFVMPQDHAFASSYMNMRAEPDAGFQKGAPIYILKQLPDIHNMIVGDIREHVIVETAVPAEKAAPVKKPRKVIKLNRG